MDIPKVLYHATYGEWLDSILEKGLIPRFHEVWTDIETGIYLANDHCEAKSYCETADETDIPEEWLDDIVILTIDTEKLNKNLFGVDPNIKWEENPEGFSTWIYRGTIPPIAISEWGDEDGVVWRREN